MYGLSIAVFIGFSWDGMFQWWEALILLLLYVAYIVIMKFNPYLMKLLAMIECKWCRYVLRVVLWLVFEIYFFVVEMNLA